MQNFKSELIDIRESLISRSYGIQVMYEITENKRSDLQTRGRAARQTDSGADIADFDYEQ